MANNRMWLVNPRTKERVMIAKFYPSSGWYAKANLVPLLNYAFNKSDFPEDPQDYAIGGMYGQKWELEYEEEPTSPAPPAIA